ncbi:hypothetical protein BJX61DRAFT_246232 [Aspergillus egyptiacus]|nr:hypothetical protein BJX61DRAFT_246232 [Aspergillus egyptiacus]
MGLLSSGLDVAARAVHIQVSPPPKNLNESRSILVALQKFGEVVYFFHQRFRHRESWRQASTIHAVFDSPNAAQSALNSKRLQIPINRDGSGNDLTLSSAETKNEARTGTDGKGRGSEDKDKAVKVAHMTCSFKAARKRNFETRRLQWNPFYGSFKPDKESAIAKDLVEGAKIDLRLLALADVPMTRKPVLKEADITRNKKIAESNKKLGATSLMGLYRQGVARAESKKQQEQKDGVKAEDV